jgi:sarcosine oxidase gamma subunit
VRIGGAQVRELFARLSALDVRAKSFPPGLVMMGSVTRCPGIVVNEGDDRLLIMVGWEYGAYLWETVLDAGAPLGIAPRTGTP